MRIAKYNPAGPPPMMLMFIRLTLPPARSKIAAHARDCRIRWVMAMPPDVRLGSAQPQHPSNCRAAPLVRAKPFTLRAQPEPGAEPISNTKLPAGQAPPCILFLVRVTYHPMF